MAKTRSTKGSKRAESYRHPEAESVLRPDVGTQAQFRKKKPPQRYRYDSSLSPALDWDEQNPARELGEALIRRILDAETIEDAKQAAEQLAALSKPFLNWAGKAERLSFDVPTLPLFVHERLSTKAILETLKGHSSDRQMNMFDLFGDAQHPVHEQVLRAYEYPDKWVNRLILGDSLVVMNSLLHYESLGGQVQMIYMDPPYGVRFGSNFQPFVRKRDVKHNDDADMTREPETVKAYRDTWELGLHSYLTYLRDRLLTCRELLTPSGSIFVQISDENVHNVRHVMEEVFGESNFCGLITFTKTGGATPRLLPSISDYILWFAKDKKHAKYVQLYRPRPPIENPYERYVCVETPDGKIIDLSLAQKLGKEPIPEGRILRLHKTDSPGATPDSETPVVYEGRPYFPPRGCHWKVTSRGTQHVVDVGRGFAVGKTLVWKSYRDEFPFRQISNSWDDVSVSGFGQDKLYAVQTNPQVIERCMLMTTSPGDLVLDPTCGSGTTPVVAEGWGRRWIAIDTSRVPLALTRQRLLTATFPYYRLKDVARGPVGGLVYERKRNRKGEEVGGIVPHVTLSSVAYGEPPTEEVLVDRPEVENKITRVSGPFWVEATIPTPVDWEGDGIEDSGVGQEEYGSFVDRMIEVLRRSPVLHVGGGHKVELRNVRKPAKSLSLSAEALLANGDAASRAESTTTPAAKRSDPSSGDAGGGAAVGEPRWDARSEKKAVAIVFGPENGSVSEKLVYEAAREAYAKSYSHLYVIGFAVQPNARQLIDKCEDAVGVAATYVQATPDLMMGDLLKNMRSSQIFSVCGLPEVKIKKAKRKGSDAIDYQVELVGLDVFDPATMDTDHQDGKNVPAWFLDTDYNDLSFHVSQAFFPRTAAWNDLKRALKADFEESVWDHLAGTESAPFEAGEHAQVAVKVIDDRGNELMVVKSLEEAEP